jgi:dUTPase
MQTQGTISKALKINSVYLGELRASVVKISNLNTEIYPGQSISQFLLTKY